MEGGRAGPTLELGSADCLWPTSVAPMSDPTQPTPDIGHERAAAPLWHGRFEHGPAAELWEYTLSLPFDQRLAPFDILGSSAHVDGLVLAGILSAEEGAAVHKALALTGAELAAGTFEFAPTDEDVHTAIERRVTELCGDAGAKLHTGRSRNDQVVTAFRLFCKDAVAVIAERITGLQSVLVDRAVSAGGAYLPGYTHLQQAQPVLLAHHLLAHFWSLSRDLDRLDSTARRLDVSTLGAGALAGSSLGLDPVATAERLGFAGVFDNSLDAVSDRDFAAEFLFDLALIGVHCSRIGEEVVMWTTQEFGFARLADEYSTGSSMLPQKKNPDIAELARGKVGRLVGNLTALLTMLKGLPLAYNRDLQEDKEPVFDSFDQVRLGLGALAGLMATLEFDTDAMAKSADSPFAAATDLAEFLVANGTPFRDAHAVVGGLVRDALAGNGNLAELVASHASLGPVAAQLLEPGVSVSKRTTHGGAGPTAVAAQLLEAHKRLQADLATAETIRARVAQ